MAKIGGRQKIQRGGSLIYCSKFAMLTAFDNNGLFVPLPSDVVCKHTKDKHSFRECISLKLLLPEAFSDQNALNISWI